MSNMINKVILFQSEELFICFILIIHAIFEESLWTDISCVAAIDDL